MVFQSIAVRTPDCRITLGRDDSLWPLLTTIAVNKMRNLFKHYSAQKRPPVENRVPMDGHNPLEVGPSAEDALKTEEVVKRGIASFPAQRKEIIRCLLLEDLTVAEIAQRVGRCHRTVYDTRKAVEKLLQAMMIES